MPVRPGPPFSRRLDWSPGENALAQLESALRHAGTPILDLTDSNPTGVDLDAPDGADALAQAFLRATTAAYAPEPRGLLSARQAVAASYGGAGGLDSDGVSDPLVERIVLTASSSESYSFLWKLLCDPGDALLVPEPSYPLFEYLARLEGVNTVPYRLAHDGTRGGTWQIDMASVDDALAGATTRVGALVVVSPNNPTGTVLDAGALRALDRRAADRGFALVADEVFADYYLEDPPPSKGRDTPPEKIRFLAGRSTEALTFSLGGLSKSCGLPQMKLGWIALGGPTAAVRDARSRLELIADTYLSVGTPVQLALPHLLRLGANRRRQIAARIAENRRLLERVCAPASSSPLTLLRSDGGWSAILRLPAVRTDEEWALAILREQGVLTHPGYFFDLRGATYLVVSLLPPPALFATAAQKLAACVTNLTDGPP